MIGEGGRTRTALVVGRDGKLTIYRIVEPDVACAQALEDEAVRCRNGAMNPRRAEALEALADVCRIAAATQERFPALRVLSP
jgi:hypothetical protein